eukprot:gene2121-21526_t
MQGPIAKVAAAVGAGSAHRSAPCHSGHAAVAFPPSAAPRPCLRAACAGIARTVAHRESEERGVSRRADRRIARRMGPDHSRSAPEA